MLGEQSKNFLQNLLTLLNLFSLPNPHQLNVGMMLGLLVFHKKEWEKSMEQLVYNKVNSTHYYKVHYQYIFHAIDEVFHQKTSTNNHYYFFQTNQSHQHLLNLVNLYLLYLLYPLYLLLYLVYLVYLVVLYLLVPLYPLIS